MPKSKSAQSATYRSFRCPSVLIEGVEELKTRWPTKIKNAQFYFLAVTYACQHQNIVSKSISGSAKETETQMIRMTPELSECVDTYIAHIPGMTKTDFYILSLVEFLKVCDGILNKVQGAFLAEGDHDGRGLLLRRTIQELFPEQKDVLDVLCEETFDAGDKVFCVTTRRALATLLLESLFLRDHLDPREIYRFA